MVFKEGAVKKYSAGEGWTLPCGAYKEFCQKGYKKTRPKPRNCGKYSLTKNIQYDTMIFHTVILCLFLDFTSNMVILAQEGAAVK